MLDSLRDFFRKYIQQTPYKGPVKDRILFLCQLGSTSVSVRTHSLKHLYDKKPAEEFNCILECLHFLILYPDQIYKNKEGKHGDICFVKRRVGWNYLCSLEKISDDEFHVVTCFRIRDMSYIKDYALLWNRGSGKPHRHVIDSLLKTIDAPQ